MLIIRQNAIILFAAFILPALPQYLPLVAPIFSLLGIFVKQLYSYYFVNFSLRQR